jgi:hypothetical protein
LAPKKLVEILTLPCERSATISFRVLPSNGIDIEKIITRK